VSSRAANLRRRYGRWAGPLVVGIIFLLLPVTTSNSYQVQLFTELAIDLLLLLGLNVISGYGGQFSLGQATFEGVGAYFMTLGALKLGMSAVVAFVLAPVVTTVIAVLIGLPSLRLRGMYFVMATLGVSIVFGLLVNDSVNISGGPNGIGPPPPLSLFGLTLTSPNAIYWLAAVFAWLGLILVEVFIGSRMGWSLRAARSSEPAAAAVGIDTFRVRMVAFAMSGALAGLAGAIEAVYSGYVTPDSFTYGSSVVLFVVLVIGGLGTFLGPLIGTMILYVFTRWLTGLDNWEPVILGGTFLLCLRIFPGGIAATIASLGHRLRDSRGAPLDDLEPADAGEQQTTLLQG
jgi:branched-chain amino acid transport system permease protein